MSTKLSSATQNECSNVARKFPQPGQRQVSIAGAGRIRPRAARKIAAFGVGSSEAVCTELLNSNAATFCSKRRRASIDSAVASQQSPAVQQVAGPVAVSIAVAEAPVQVRTRAAAEVCRRARTGRAMLSAMRWLKLGGTALVRSASSGTIRRFLEQPSHVRLGETAFIDAEFFRFVHSFVMLAAQFIGFSSGTKRSIPAAAGQSFSAPVIITSVPSDALLTGYPQGVGVCSSRLAPGLPFQENQTDQKHAGLDVFLNHLSESSS